MGKIRRLIDKVKLMSNCTIYDFAGLPSVSRDHILPDDVSEFFTLCGGMDLFIDSPYSVKIVKPSDVVLANPILISKEIIEAEIVKGTYEKELSINWYIIADLNNSDFITIDFSKKRLGYCYRAFWDSYAMRGESPIVAISFTEFVERIIDNKGEYWYFHKKEFTPYGDAYDEDI